MTNKILITGASGFVGACLAENLINEGYDVGVVSRNIDKAWRLKKIIKQVKTFNIDLCDEESVNRTVMQYRPNKIFHLATYGGYPFQNKDDKILLNNIFSTYNLVNAARKIDFDSFINVSSSSEYGIKGRPMGELDLLEPINTYGISKITSTLYAKMISENNKLPITTVRLFSPYGYYEDKTRLVSSVILSCINGENPKLANGEAVRDFIFIEDAIDMLKTISKRDDLIGQIYNCGSGVQHSVREMVDSIVEISGKDLIPEWGKLQGRKSDTSKWQADMSKTEKSLYWKPKFSIFQGVQKSYKWYCDNLQLYMGENKWI